MDNKNNVICGLKVLLEPRGWGGNLELSADTREKAMRRLEEIKDVNILSTELLSVHNRNDCIMRANHFRGRDYLSQFKLAVGYLTNEETVDQVFQAYHRDNILFDSYKQAVEETHQFPELPNEVYAQEKGWGGSSNVGITNGEDAKMMLRAMNRLEDQVGELENVVIRDDELMRLIHFKETAIANYLTQSMGSFAPNEIKDHLVKAYCRNHTFFDLYQSLDKAEDFLSDVFREAILGERKSFLANAGIVL